MWPSIKLGVEPYPKISNFKNFGAYFLGICQFDLIGTSWATLLQVHKCHIEMYLIEMNNGSKNSFDLSADCLLVRSEFWEQEDGREVAPSGDAQAHYPNHWEEDSLPVVGWGVRLGRKRCHGATPTNRLRRHDCQKGTPQCICQVRTWWWKCSNNSRFLQGSVYILKCPRILAVKGEEKLGKV